MTETIEQRTRRVCDELSAALQEFALLRTDEDSTDVPGPPATDSELAELTAAFGKPLPTTYRELLRLHNGWRNISGEAGILSLEERQEPWFREAIDDLCTLWAEEDKSDPQELGWFPAFLGPTEQNAAWLDPATVTDDGEMQVVATDGADEVRRYPDIQGFLENQSRVLRRLIDKEKIGA